MLCTSCLAIMRQSFFIFIFKKGTREIELEEGIEKTKKFTLDMDASNRFLPSESVCGGEGQMRLRFISKAFRSTPSIRNGLQLSVLGRPL